MFGKRPKEGDRVLVGSLGPYRGKTGRIVKVRKQARFKYVVKMDSGEVIYSGVVRKLDEQAPIAA